MDYLSEYYKIAHWIAGDISGTISPEDKASLEKWLEEDELNPQIYHHITIRLAQETKIPKEMESILKDWKNVKGQLSHPQKQNIFRRPFYRYAAIIILLLGTGISYWQSKQLKKESVISTLALQEVSPGSSKAILTLSTGEKVELESILTDSIQKDGMLITKKEGELSYQHQEEQNKAEQEIFNTITIPRGGEYKLMLADGTKVWLNAASQLRYPVKFVKSSRTVYLKGEAYFEVTKDSIHPFIVETAALGIKVLGTGFNIMAYPDETLAKVTLVHGKVGVQAAGKESILHPAEQYVYEIASQTGEIQKVDVTNYISWKNGVLIFDGMPLRDLVASLSRWYDVDFFFTSEHLKNLKFSGSFKKYDEIQYVLNLIEETTDVHFILKNKTITVIRK